MLLQKGALMKLLTFLLLAYIPLLQAQDLLLSKVCPVTFEQRKIGILALSMPWYHSGRDNASYIASDNATGIGIEIHYFNNASGQVLKEHGRCDAFRLLQVRETNSLLDAGESKVQVDAPSHLANPFYDQYPLEYGRGTHLTPQDSRDKPWSGQLQRASTVALYDTPYISDAYGIDGKDINVRFETCLVCQREQQADLLLSCAHWGYQREYMGGMTGWAEPEVLTNSCAAKPSEQFVTVLAADTKHDYYYWFDWR